MFYRIASYGVLILSILFLYVGTLSIYLYNQENVLKVNVSSIEEYYVVFEFNKEEDALILDEKGVTYVDYSKIKSLGVKNATSYNPVTVGLQGLRYFQEYRNTHNNEAFELFLAHSNWLVDNISADGSWYIKHDKKIGKNILHSPWNSALSQGFSISLLTRAYIVTGNEDYLIVARKALEPFTKYIEEGGVRSKQPSGDFFEEYPVKNNPTHVLNGFVFALFGLYDLYKVDNNIKAKELFDEGVESLKILLPAYDLGNWTRYDLNQERNLKNHWGYSSPWYQKLHVAQLYGLYQITKDNYFLKYSKIFENQEKRSWVNLIIYPSYVLYTDFVKIYRFIQG